MFDRGLKPTNGAAWSIRVEPHETEKLRGLPGLRFEYRRVVGRTDAIQAALIRVGSTPLSVIHGTPQSHVLPRDLRDYQVQGVCRLHTLLTREGGALLADDLGLGKTRQAIELMKLIGPKHMVVTVARSRETWRDELLKWWPECTFYVMDPKHQTPPDFVDVLIVSSDALAKGWEPPWYPRFLILEEMHELRGRNTKRGAAISLLAVMSQYRLGITATPDFNLPKDLYTQLSLIMPGAFGSGFEFDMAYCNAKTNEHGHLEAKGVSNVTELKTRLAYYTVRRTKAEVAKELPSLTRQVVWVEEIKAASTTFKKAIQQRATRLWHLAREAACVAKYDVVADLAFQAKRALIFTWRHVDVEQIVKRLTEKGMNAIALSDATDVNKKQKMIRQAVASGASIVSTLDGAYMSLNMQDVASVGIMHSLDHVPNKMAQGEGRLHRLGQTKPVTWYYPAVKDSWDVIVIEQIITKMDHHRKLLGEDNSTALRNSLQDAGGSEDEGLAALYEYFANKHGEE